jgi:hypothetical protein
VTLTIATISRGSPTLRLALAPGPAKTDDLPVYPYCHDGHPLGRHLGQLRRVLTAAPLQRALEEEVLRFASRGGYAMTPEPRPHRPLTDRDRVCNSELGALAWFLRSGEVVWSACGVVHTHPAGEGVVELLAAVTAAGSHRVADLVRGAAPLRSMLEELLRHRVLDLV